MHTETNIHERPFNKKYFKDELKTSVVFKILDLFIKKLFYNRGLVKPEKK